MTCSKMDNIIQKFNDFTQKPVKFLTVQDNIKDDVKSFVKTVYDFTKSQDNTKKDKNTKALPELIVNDFDEEQIWQEIELQNSDCWDRLVWQVANCISIKNDLLFPVKIADAKTDEDDSDNLDSEDELGSNSENEENQSEKATNQQKSSKPSIVDDKFFKLKEMEQFLLKEERKDAGKEHVDSDDESIDLFEDIEESDDDSEVEGGGNAMYHDFFNEEEQHKEKSNNMNTEQDIESEEIDNSEKNVEIKKKKVTFANMSDDDDEIEETDSNTSELNNSNLETNATESKSEFELRQQRLKDTIDRLENKSLKEAPWQLKGEVSATKRPQNSLLQEVLDFDLTSRPAPIITEQTTYTLEDIIKRRIKDKAWDDVEKKEKPVDDQLVFRKKEILDQSKSKLSLAQVYEAEYLKQKQALSGEVEEQKEPESHTEIRTAMAKLFSKLDALSHYHYTPKPPQAEVKIISNTPAISMEEVAPVATSDAALLAPEEVKRKRKGELISKDERTQTDKNRERRRKKKLQHKKGKVEKVTEHRNTKKGVEASDKSLKTSKAFFQQLNDDSSGLIKKNKNKNK